MTTNSGSGIENYDVYYPVFKAMEEEGMVLNLHGEVPSDHEKVSIISFSSAMSRCASEVNVIPIEV